MILRSWAVIFRNKGVGSFRRKDPSDPISNSRTCGSPTSLNHCLISVPAAFGGTAMHRLGRASSQQENHQKEHAFPPIIGGNQPQVAAHEPHVHCLIRSQADGPAASAVPCAASLCRG